jgi:hypothetical protein
MISAAGAVSAAATHSTAEERKRQTLERRRGAIFAALADGTRLRAAYSGGAVSHAASCKKASEQAPSTKTETTKRGEERRGRADRQRPSSLVAH